MQLMSFVRRAPRQPRLDVKPLDPGRWQLWQGIRHLFPAHANAVQTAAPIVIRASEDLFEILEVAPLDDDDFFGQCIEKVKQGLTGYDPYALFPQVRVITVDA